MPDTKRTPSPRTMPHGGGIQIFYQGKGAIRRPTVARAEGIYMWDTEGRRYIDASSGPIVSNIGHGNKRVLAAMIEQAEKVAFASRAVFENEPNARLADLITGLAGPGLRARLFRLRRLRGDRDRHQARPPIRRRQRRGDTLEGDRPRPRLSRRDARRRFGDRRPAGGGDVRAVDAGDAKGSRTFHLPPAGQSRCRQLCARLRRRPRRYDPPRRRRDGARLHHGAGRRVSPPARWSRRITTIAPCARSATATAYC